MWTHTRLAPALDAAADIQFPKVSDLREAMRNAAVAKNGGCCSGCGQTVKVYKRPITKAMAKALIVIYMYQRKVGFLVKSYVHVPDLLEAQIKSGKPPQANWAGGDFAKLRFWGLIVPLRAVRDDGSNRVGCWRLTQLGRKFVEGMATVQAQAICYGQKGDQLLYLDGPQIDIQKALDEPFDFRKIK